MPDLTIHEAAEAYLDHLRAQGKKDRTLYTYRKDIELVEAFFGGDKPVRGIRTPQVGKFLKSGALLKLPSGRERAKPTLDKTVRAGSPGWHYRVCIRRMNLRGIPATFGGAYRVWPCHRMFLVWARDAGHIAELPLPKDTPMGRSNAEGGMPNAE